MKLIETKQSDKERIEIANQESGFFSILSEANFSKVTAKELKSFIVIRF